MRREPAAYLAGMLSWLPLIAAAAHITEEFVWPGGFTAWYRAYRPSIARSLSTRYLVAVNALLLALCALIPLQGLHPRTVALLLTIVAVLFGNGIFHLYATLRFHRYSPGVVTGVTLYLPLGIYAYGNVLRSGLASPGTAIVAAAMGSAYQFVSVANHRRRERHLEPAGTGPGR